VCRIELGVDEEIRYWHVIGKCSFLNLGQEKLNDGKYKNKRSSL
jgi:hypothetical protein